MHTLRSCSRWPNSGGHRASAQAMESMLEQVAPGATDVRIVDLDRYDDTYRAFFKKLGQAGVLESGRVECDKFFERCCEKAARGVRGRWLAELKRKDWAFILFNKWVFFDM